MTTGAVTKYYAANGHSVAMRKGTGGQLLYMLTDHLGSTGAIVDPATDTVLASRRYWPYGGERALSGDARVTSHWYTGQRDEECDGLGLYNYNARFYSTITGRFLSVDPWGAHIGSTATLNGYTYANDNPLAFGDPSGLVPQCFIVCTGAPDELVVDPETGTGSGGPPTCNDLCRCAADIVACLALGDAQTCHDNPALCVEDPGCSPVTGCAPEFPCACGSENGLPSTSYAVGFAAGASLECEAATEGACTLAIPAIAGATVGYVACKLTCEPVLHGAATVSAKGWNTFYGKKQATGEVGIAGATKGRRGIIKLPDGTYLEKNTNQQGARQAHQGEQYEQQDPRRQRHRGVVVKDGKVIGVTEWKPGRATSP